MQLPVPFVIYADFEALTKKVHGCKPNNDKLYNDTYQKHTDCVIKSFAVMMINTQKQFRFIEVKMLYSNLWEKCLKRLNIVKMSSNTNSKSH